MTTNLSVPYNLVLDKNIQQLMVDVHQNWLNWSHFLIPMGVLLIILLDYMIFLSWSLDAARTFMFLSSYSWTWNSLPTECFPLTMTLNRFFLFLFFYLAAPQPTLGYYWEGIITCPILITAFLLSWTWRSPGASERGWVPNPSWVPSGVWNRILLILVAMP